MAIPQTTGYQGCALGAAAFAIGKNHHYHKGVSLSVHDVVKKEWPWLMGDAIHPERGDLLNIITIIGDLNGFNRLRWDRNAIADWVKTIEPQEELTNEAEANADTQLGRSEEACESNSHQATSAFIDLTVRT